jgi:hypothetical protein
VTFALDAHVHVYPCHDADRALRTLIRRLPILAAGRPEVLPAACLAESAACAWFRQLAAGAGRLSADIRVRPADDPAGLWCETSDGSLLLVAGRQIITAERLEILALAVAAEFPDGLAAADAIARVRAAGGVPVLSWAPGKWFGGRGRAVSRLLAETAPDSLLIGDTSLRPLGWGEPALMRQARRFGFRIVAGSDPLPLPGEERVLGGYGCTLAAPCDREHPVASLRGALASAAVPIRIAGRRGAPWTVARRLAAHAAARRGARRGFGQG